MTAVELARFLAGLALLLFGAEALVRGASRLAAALGVAPLVIGLTVVAFGTSSPEIAASLVSARAGQGDLALGNVVGSNLFNILVVLGLAALVSPLAVHRKLLRADVPIMIGVAALPWLLAGDGRIDRMEGSLLAVALLPYLLFQLRGSRNRREDRGQEPVARRAMRPRTAALLTAAGLAMLTAGAGWLVDGAAAIARAFGASELVIGLTLVAAGTSLPEAATSLVAALRGEREIAVGNVVGSNVFNILAVLGLSAALSPAGVPVAAAARLFDLPFLLAASVACLPLFVTGLRLDRWEGGLFVAVYLLYLGQLLWTADSSTPPSPAGVVTALLGGAAILVVAQLARRGRGGKR